ncbi:hypothetical protein Y032_0069g337 [Ancylostoma ceylanicum]|uniref:Uncharacterized protein n=1 Tax=Ancylostoma ceylanicum TaxID=53326 RepID=A0A016TZ91_9BILA|nr:hypothetical protein Y032_0069g337 [Ancylostoma ceylanicum]
MTVVLVGVPDESSLSVLYLAYLFPCQHELDRRYCMELESLDCFDCACDTYVRVVSADSTTGVRCSARTVRGAAVTRCWEKVTSSFESPDVGVPRSLCCRHQGLFLRHASCLFCNCFSDTCRPSFQERNVEQSIPFSISLQIDEKSTGAIRNTDFSVVPAIDLRRHCTKCAVVLGFSRNFADFYSFLYERLYIHSFPRA